ncbi:MAG: DEAD/DEAH box helicase [Actinomycetota bacterium]
MARHAPAHAALVTQPEHEFQLDRFQIDAIAAIDLDRHVVVSAPTGSGKTVVAEHAIERARSASQRSFYTTPIKALSNQKYHDLVARYGEAAVGLLTGDRAINAGAPVVVMTTEVLRNMLYTGSRDLTGLGTVIVDEVHFLQDAYRGPVWEEVLIHLPSSAQLVCLSATVSNAPELADWISSLKGDTTTVVETHRPVELRQHYFVAERGVAQPTLLPMFVNGAPNADGGSFDGGERRGRDRYRNGGRTVFSPRRGDAVRALAAHQMLPAIYFIFSRAQCDEAAATCHRLGISLTTAEERERIHDHITRHLRGLDDEERRALDVDRFSARLLDGIGAHHAGMIPAMKETVEACFVDGVVKVVFATETLAVGINMPARTVVIEKLTKYNGETHEQLTAAEFTQLTGRAGRRGIDAVGHAAVCWSPSVTFNDVVGLASSRSFRLRSAFRSTYNMAVNLVARHDRTGAHRLLDRSFAQFQADRDVVKLANKLERRIERRDAARTESISEFGDIDSYRSRRRADREAQAAERSARGAELRSELRRLRPGTVISVDGGRGHGPGVVIANADRRGRRRLRVVGASGSLIELDERDLLVVPEVLGAIELPAPYAPNRKEFRRAVRRELNHHRFERSADAAAAVTDRSSGDAGRSSIDPIERDPDLRHKLDRAAAADRLDRQIGQLEQQIDRAEHSVAREFDRIVAVLVEYGFVDDERWMLTSDGERLSKVFHESDLLAVVLVRDGCFDGLGAPDVAALVSMLVYEHRSSEPPAPPWFASRTVRSRAADIAARSAALAAIERGHSVPVHRAPDPGFAAIAHGWVSGEHLTGILDEEDLTGGDFVRTMKQLIDLLRQLAGIAPEQSTAAALADAAESAWRGVVADEGLSEL